MLKFFGFSRRKLRAELKKNAAWLRGRLPWPFSKKEPKKVVVIVHVQRDAPGHFTRHYFRKMITNRMRGVLAFFSLCLTAASLGLSSHLLAMGSKAVEFSAFLGLVDSVGVIPMASFVIFVSGIQVAAYSIGCIQCCRAISSIYRSDLKNKHGWMALYSFVLYGGLIGLIIIICLTVVHERLTDTLFQRGLWPAMKKYGRDENIKKVIDKMQMTLQCCGGVTYKDWWNISWWPEQYTDFTNKVVQSKVIDGSFLIDDVPFSCCNVRHVGPCVHKSMKANLDRPDVVLPSVYSVGCATALRKIFTETVVPTIQSSAIGGLSVLVVLFITYRYLATSLSVARAAGNGAATAVGYLLSWRYRRASGGLQSELYALIMKSVQEIPSGDVAQMAVGKTMSPSPAPAAPMMLGHGVSVPYERRWNPGAGRYPVGYNDASRYMPTSSPYGVYRSGFGQYPGLPYYYNYNYGYHNKNKEEAENSRSESSSSSSSSDDLEMTTTSSSTVDEESQLNNSNCLDASRRLQETPSTSCGYDGRVSADTSRDHGARSSETFHVESSVIWLEGGDGVSVRSPILAGGSTPNQPRLTPQLIAAHLKSRRRRKCDVDAATSRHRKLVPRSTLNRDLEYVLSSVTENIQVDAAEVRHERQVNMINDVNVPAQLSSCRNDDTKIRSSVALEIIPPRSSNQNDAGRGGRASNDGTQHCVDCVKPRSRHTRFQNAGVVRHNIEIDDGCRQSPRAARLPCVADRRKVQQWLEDHQHLMIPDLVESSSLTAAAAAAAAAKNIN